MCRVEHVDKFMEMVITDDTMDLQAIIESLCRDAEYTLNMDKRDKFAHTVRLNMGSRPSGWALPARGMSPYGYLAYAEIRVDNDCIFRQTMCIDNPLLIQVDADRLLILLLRSVFNHGLFSTTINTRIMQKEGYLPK